MNKLGVVGSFLAATIAGGGIDGGNAEAKMKKPLLIHGNGISLDVDGGVEVHEQKLSLGDIISQEVSSRVLHFLDDLVDPTGAKCGFLKEAEFLRKSFFDSKIVRKRCMTYDEQRVEENKIRDEVVRFARDAIKREIAACGKVIRIPDKSLSDGGRDFKDKCLFDHYGKPLTQRWIDRHCDEDSICR